MLLLRYNSDMSDSNARYYGAAASYNKPTNSNPIKTIGLLAGGLVAFLLVVFVVFQVFAAITSGPKRELEQLIAREQDLVALTVKYETQVTDPALAKINSEATILITSDVVSLTSQLQKEFGAEAPSEATVTAETDTTSEAKLQSATQNGRFNEEYRAILGQKVAASLELAQIVQQSSSGDLTVALDKNIANLTYLADQL